LPEGEEGRNGFVGDTPRPCDWERKGSVPSVSSVGVLYGGLGSE
jgi:hypothetical protein